MLHLLASDKKMAQPRTKIFAYPHSDVENKDDCFSITLALSKIFYCYVKQKSHISFVLKKNSVRNHSLHLHDNN